MTIGTKQYDAIVMSVETVDRIMESALGVNSGLTRRGDKLSYTVRFRNAKELEQFQIRMGERAFHYHNSSDVPESTAKELLADQLGLKRIDRLFVNEDDQFILIEK